MPNDSERRYSAEEIVQESLARRHTNSPRYRQEPAPPRDEEADIMAELTAGMLHEIRREEDALFFAALNGDRPPQHTVSTERAADAGANYIRARMREGGVLREMLQPEVILPPPTPVRKSTPVLHDMESVERVMTV